MEPRAHQPRAHQPRRVRSAPHSALSRCGGSPRGGCFVRKSASSASAAAASLAARREAACALSAAGGGSAPKHERRSATLSKQPLETRHCAAPVWSRAGSPASARSKLERWRRCAMMAVARSSAATGGKDTGGGASNGATAAGGTNVATEGATTIGGAPGGQALEPPSRSASCLRLS